MLIIIITFATTIWVRLIVSISVLSRDSIEAYCNMRWTTCDLCRTTWVGRIGTAARSYVGGACQLLVQIRIVLLRFSIHKFALKWCHRAILVGVLHLGNKVISGWVLTCDNAHLTWLYSAAPLGDQADSTMTTQSHYFNTEPTSPCPILVMPSAWLGSDKYNFFKSLV